MYGVGHGGFEAILILGIVSINNLVNAVLLNTGAFTAALSEDLDVQQALEAVPPPCNLAGMAVFPGRRGTPDGDGLAYCPFSSRI